MKRYQCITAGDICGGISEMEENSNGEWVRFEDHAAEVHRLNNELTSVTLERDALKTALNHIAYETLGHAEASPAECLQEAERIAREALK